MRKVYYPSCKLNEWFPNTAQAATEYMEKRQDAVIGMCCRDEDTKAGPDDTAVFNCNTCAIFLDEWSDAGSSISIYELIDGDQGFSFPDHQGKSMAVQDCWRSNDRPEIHKAIRSLAAKMNIQIVELDESGADSVFCGEATMMPMPPYYPEYAPDRFGKSLPDWAFQEVDPEERKEKMRAYAAAIPVDDVICNCAGCVFGILVGGKRPFHILELVFGTEK
ncbi:MAG: hypothetical protein FWG23_03195 [Eggerthellaceae bacterium]|jgi:hypothetical protein|nr:hypothetical protein [Eggerthellaceae bacterium]MDR2716116.1 hypothetical protein [Coriobacteriaceae bacterium]